MTEEMIIVTMKQIKDNNLYAFIRSYIPMNNEIYGELPYKHKDRI